LVGIDVKRLDAIVVGVLREAWRARKEAFDGPGLIPASGLNGDIPGISTPQSGASQYRCVSFHAAVETGIDVSPSQKRELNGVLKRAK
jgi:hypothetical protein